MEKVSQIFNVPTSLIKRYYGGESRLPEYRTEFMRDRDRLMYATAFRRLAGKTQIYTVGADDHRKNRLTHTLEVAQIARTIALALGLNPDLAEAIALGHDFGHTPFGHAGEEMLHQIMIPRSSCVKKSPFYEKGYSAIKERFEREDKDNMDYLECAFGFKHNLQSVRVAGLLEDSYRGSKGENIGLNLTNFSLYGMMIHSKTRYSEEDRYPNFQDYFKEHMKMDGCDAFAWSFEAYIVKWADDIAQWHHDLEDAMREGVLPLGVICDTIERAIGKVLSSADKERLDGIRGNLRMDRHCVADLSGIVVNTLVTDLVKQTSKNFAVLEKELKAVGIDNSVMLFSNFDQLSLADEKGKLIRKEDIVAVSDDVDTDGFKNRIKGSIHHSRNVERMNEKGKYIIRKLFEAYKAHPQQLPDGPILHLLVDAKVDGCSNIDEIKKAGIGEARVKFDKLLKNPTIYFECLLMRRICDHIASMTDRYAIEEYNSLYG